MLSSFAFTAFTEKQIQLNRIRIGERIPDVILFKIDSKLRQQLPFYINFQSNSDQLTAYQNFICYAVFRRKFFLQLNQRIFTNKQHEIFILFFKKKRFWSFIDINNICLWICLQRRLKNQSFAIFHDAHLFFLNAKPNLLFADSDIHFVPPAIRLWCWHWLNL